MEDSIKKWKLEYLDLVLLHDPTAGKELRLEAYKALEFQRQQGYIKSIGVSNYGVKHLEELVAAGLPAPGKILAASKAIRF